MSTDAFKKKKNHQQTKQHLLFINQIKILINILLVFFCQMLLGMYTSGKDVSGIHLDCHKYHRVARMWNYREHLSYCGIIVSFHIHFCLSVSP